MRKRKGDYKKLAKRLSNIVENFDMDRRELLYIKYELMKPVLTTKHLKELNELYDVIEERMEAEFIRLEKLRLEIFQEK